MLGLEYGRQEVGVRGVEAVERSVAVEQVGELGEALVMEGFVSEEKDFELDLLWDREPLEVL